MDFNFMKNSLLKKNVVNFAVATLLVNLCASSPVALAVEATDTTQLQQSFLQPPDDARIMVRWWWFGPAVTHFQLEREMKLMKEGALAASKLKSLTRSHLMANCPASKI